MHALLKWKLKKKLSFADIGERTGFTRTKVHRQLTGNTRISVDDAVVYFEATDEAIPLDAILGLKRKPGSAHVAKS